MLPIFNKGHSVVKSLQINNYQCHWPLDELFKDTIIVDFDDSFTYNLVSECVLRGLNTQVVHWTDVPIWGPVVLESLQKKVILLGPGPGHPQEYCAMFEWIEQFCRCEHLFVVGVCLGHQLIWSMKGHLIKRLKTPIHGRSLLVNLDNAFFQVSGLLPGKYQLQFYNSWAVDPIKTSQEDSFFIQDGYCLIGSGKRILTYQFHPESVGTTHKDVFFRPLTNFLKTNLRLMSRP